jgi:hypothetical protein
MTLDNRALKDVLSKVDTSLGGLRVRRVLALNTKRRTSAAV